MTTNHVVSQRSTWHLVTLLAICILIGVFFPRAILDDGYIYLVVTKNIVAGEGWRFNPNGTIVNPCTSALYTLLLVAWQWIRVSPIAATMVLYSLGTWTASAGLYLLYRERSPLIAVVVSLYYTMHPVFLRSMGLETSLFIASIIWTALFWSRSRYTSAAACACAASLLRIDGLLLLGILPALTFRHVPRAKVIKTAGLTAIPLVSWCLFSYLSFGHVMPQSVRVKAVQANVGFWQQQGPWIRALFSSPTFPLGTWLSAALCLFLCRKNIPKAQKLIFLFCSSQVLVYACAGAPAGYWWYFAPACLMVDLLVCEGFLLLEQGAISLGGQRLRLGGDDRWATSYRAVLLFGALTTVAVTPVAAPVTYPHATEYKEIADWINRNSPERAPTVAAVEIGYLGYFLNGPILDVHGLIHPKALAQLTLGNLTWWYKEPHPDFIVIHSPTPWNGEPSLRWAPPTYEDFQARYREAYTAISGSVKVFALRHDPHPLQRP